MEAVVFEDSPLAAYLEGEGGGERGWAPACDLEVSLSPSSLSFAPTGRPVVQSKFRNKLPPALRISIPPNATVAVIHNTCSNALRSSLGRADNTGFLEQFRYIIVASQLLSEHSYGHGSRIEAQDREAPGAGASQCGAFTLTGAVVTALLSFGLVWMINWVRGGRELTISIGRVMVAFGMLLLLSALAYAYIRRKWLQHVRQLTLAGASNFVANAQALDGTTLAAITFIQEVELVSRGYRISTPLPPITRLEDRSQNRRCLRLRHTLHHCLTELTQRYSRATSVLKPLTDFQNLEKFYDIYDLSDLDLQEASLGCIEGEFEDKDSLRVLKISMARLHTIRKVFLCCLLALDADGGKSDFLRWNTAVSEIHSLTSITGDAEMRLHQILSEEESFPVPATPKLPLTPGRDRWRAQLRKLNTLSTGIRGLQAKLHVLREESDKTLNESVDMSELGTSLMFQYESIGVDLKALMQDWEEGKVTLAATIDRNEKRISSMSGMQSPTTSLSGLTSVEEGSPTNALRALNGDEAPRSRLSLDLSSSDAEEVYEAIAIPRQRSALTREERIVKMKEDRERRESLRDKAEANTHMLRELESVINLKARVLEARLEQANLLKKVVDAIKDLVQDCNFDCNDSGIALQAMDNSHVALVSMMLKAEGFSPYRCDRNIALGVNLTSLTKVLRAAQNEDILTLKAEDTPDVLNLVFESSESDRLSEYDLKLMDIDQEHLGIPDTEYATTISMPSSEFRRICTDLIALSESVTIEATKDGVKFLGQGDIGSGAVTLRSHTNVEKPELNVDIELSEPVSLTFSLKYLVNFCKASGLSSTVKLCLSHEVPLLVEYGLSGSSYLRFYLAPKIGDEE